MHKYTKHSCCSEALISHKHSLEFFDIPSEIFWTFVPKQSYFHSFMLWQKNTAVWKPETQRQATQHDLRSQWRLGKWKVCGEENIILYWADKSSQGRTKVYCTGITSPTIQPRKDPFQMYFPICHSLNSQQCHPSLVSLMTTYNPTWDHRSILIGWRCAGPVRCWQMRQCTQCTGSRSGLSCQGR